MMAESPKVCLGFFAEFLSKYVSFGSCPRHRFSRMLPSIRDRRWSGHSNAVAA
jgi:hypothetical protein